MIGQWVHYSLIILFSIGALVAFILTWWGQAFDWTEEASNTLFKEESKTEDER